MSAQIQCVEYYHASIKDRPGEAYRMLSKLAGAGVNLLAFSVIPMGTEYTQVVLFPRETDVLARFAEENDLVLVGPQRAFLIQGDDELGALVEVHSKLSAAKINVYASSGVTDGRGGYGYTLYVRSDAFETAKNVLEL